MATENPTSGNPRNPYGSFVVTASAGCGKTYQLARRFLCLVSAGADPATILTVTFTRKAAAEMRERILGDAARLLTGGTDAVAFDQEMRNFYRNSRLECEEKAGFDLPNPLSASETGRRVINQSQALRISTIDSIFHDWVARFPAETGLAGDASTNSGMRLASDMEVREIEDAAWQSANLESLKFAGTALDTSSADANPATVLSCARNLDQYRNLLWLYRDDGRDNRNLTSGTTTERPAWLWNPDGQDPAIIEEQLFAGLSADWSALAEVLKPERRDELLALLQTRDWDGLRSAKFLSAGFKLNGNTFREKTTAAVAAERARIEDMLASHGDNLRISALVDRGSAAAGLYLRFQDIFAAFKRNKGIITFDDLLAGSARVFSDPYAAGARYLLQHRIRHLMFDEFQDTSWSQWAIFRELALEILSAAAAPLPGTVFMVGDEKQSIYSFRSSDPEVMQHAAAELASHGVCRTPLNTSYRTGRTLLDYVNKSFDGIMDDFPEHSPAVVDGRLVNPDVSGVTLLPVVDDNVLPGLSAPDAAMVESSMLAAWLQRALSGEIPHPVYNKATGRFRPLRTGDCAILFRTNHRMFAMERALQKLDIPVMREESRGLLDHQEVRDIINLARLFAHPDDIHALVAVLKSPFVAASDEQVASLIAGGQGIYAANASLQWLAARRDHASRMRPSSLLRACLEESGYLARVRQGGISEVEWIVLNQHISALFDLIESLEQNSAGGLHGVLASLTQMAKLENLHIGSATDSGDVNAVRLMTIHKSKGLEFPLVAIVDSANCWVDAPTGWMKSTSATARGLVWLGNQDDRPASDPRFNDWMREAVTTEAAEANRLWYVALTRARQYLVLSGQERQTSKQLVPLLGGLPLLNHEKLTAALQDTGQTVSTPLQFKIHTPLASQPELDITAPLDVVVQRIATEGGVAAERKAGVPAAAAKAEPDKSSIMPAPRIADASLLEAGVRTLVASRFSGMGHGSGKASAVESPQDRTERMSAVLAAAFGTLVHAALEHFVNYDTLSSFDPVRTWARICNKSLIMVSSAAAQRTFTEAVSHAHAVVSSPAWKSLLERFPRKRSEVPVVMLGADATLHQGTMDLVMDDGVSGRDPANVLVVDYKTSRAGDPSAAGNEAHQAHESQVRAYMDFLKETWPRAKVTGCLFYTRTLSLREIA